MSSSFSDPASSQNDSETHFIPGYIMEVEDEAVGSNPVKTTNCGAVDLTKGNLLPMVIGL